MLFLKNSLVLYHPLSLLGKITPRYKIIFIIIFNFYFLFGQKTIIRNGNYIDIKNNRVVPFKQIVLSQGLIESVDQDHLSFSSASSASSNGELREFDLKGKFLSLGIINAHSSMIFSTLDLWARSGLTTSVILGYSFNDYLKELKEKKMLNYVYFNTRTIDYKKQAGDIYYSGPLLIYSNRTLANSFVSTKRIDHLEEGLKVVRQLFDEEAIDFLYIDVTTKENSPRMPVDLLKNLIKFAHTRNKKVIAHSENSGDALYAIENGADIVEMDLGIGVLEDELLEMAERKVPLITSLARNQGLGKVSRQEALFQFFSDESKENVKKYLDAGGKLLVGSAYGSPWIRAGIPFQEIEIYQALGYGDDQILKWLTTEPVKELGLNQSGNRTQQKGEIAEGFEADLIVLEKNPLENIETLKNIIMVFNDGNLVYDQNHRKSYLQVGFEYSKYFTKEDALAAALTPYVDSYPITFHLSFSPKTDVLLVDDGLHYFDFGLATRFMFPGKKHVIGLANSMVFYKNFFYHLEGSYEYRFTEKLRLGIRANYVPNLEHKGGLQFTYRRPIRFYPGSGQWFHFLSDFNYESYDQTKIKLIALRNTIWFDFYDYVPSWMSHLKFKFDLDLAIDPIDHEKYLAEFLKFDLGIGFWELNVWQGKYWGDEMDRFRYRESSGDLRSVGGFYGREYKTNFENSIFGWSTSMAYSVYNLGFFSIILDLFWEMQKREQNFERIFVWDDQWLMDFGSSLSLNFSNFIKLNLGGYIPVTYLGKVTMPGFYMKILF